MERHPGGAAQTKEMLLLSGLSSGARILDMGAGDGSAVQLMNSMGYQACGIDLDPANAGKAVQQGDFLELTDEDGVYDGILTQCSFFVSSNIQKALSQAYRVLKPGGRLMYSDVWFESRQALVNTLEQTGFSLLHIKDMTEEWRAYYLEALWTREDTKELCGYKGPCRYYSVIAERK